MSIFNIRSNLKTFYLDRLWCRNGEKQRFDHIESLSFLVSIVLIVVFVCPLWICVAIFLLFFLVDFVYPWVIFVQWSRCLESIRHFNETIENEREWLKKIHGFQLIRTNSSLFDTQLVELRQNLFVELRHEFLRARNFARLATKKFDDENSPLISTIDLNEFGPLISADPVELRKLTNEFDSASINSMSQLCRLQLDEMIHLIEMNRFDSFFKLFKYQDEIRLSMEKIRRAKKNCSTFVDVFPSSFKSKSNRLTSAYFLLRSSAERLFDLNEENGKFNDESQRIINDLKTVIFSLEALRNAPNSPIKIEEKTSRTIDSPPEISVSYRFDDDLVESIDEILVGETSGETDEKPSKIDDFDDQNLLREQTRCLMKELENAIEGKKNEWNEREKRLFGDQPAQIVEKPKIEMPRVETKVCRVTPISMLDELKETFAQKNPIDEDTFGDDSD